jgi:hypothetical protein
MKYALTQTGRDAIESFMTDWLRYPDLVTVNSMVWQAERQANKTMLGFLPASDFVYLELSKRITRTNKTELLQLNLSKHFVELSVTELVEI